MYNKKRLNLHLEQIVKGEITLDDAAFRLNLTTSEVQVLLKQFSLRGGVVHGFKEEFLESLTDRLEEWKIAFRSYPALRRMKMKTVYALSSFAIVAAGVVMISAAGSVFPGEMFAGEQGQDIYQNRVKSNMSYRNSRVVNRQLSRADSVYDRMLKVLGEKGEGNDSLRQAILERKQKLTGIRTQYISKGKAIEPKNKVVYNAGDLYQRLLDQMPEADLQAETTLATHLLKRSQEVEEKLAVVRRYYVSSLHKPEKKISKPTTVVATPAETTVETKVKSKLTRNEMNLRLRKIAAKYKMKKVANRHKRYDPSSKMAVISRFNKENQILRSLDKQFKTDVPVTQSM
jgi:hypothetical protein